MYRYSNSTEGAGSSGNPDTEIRNLAQDFRTAFNTANYDQVAALFASDGLFMAPHHEAAIGPKAVERKLREFGDAGYQDLRKDTTRVDVSGDMAMEIGRYTVSIVKEDGSSSIDRGKYLAVWRRLGAWRIVADCWCSSQPQEVATVASDKALPVAEKLSVLADDAGKIA
jgi:uncharacterized protein (TIGR02246 family)